MAWTRRTALAEFARFGIGKTLPLSAAHNRGTDDLIAAVLPMLPAEEPDVLDEGESGSIRVAIVGRPNAGKSTLINRLLGEDRLIVSDVAGTTRDPIRVPLERDGKRYTLIDTAGVRRKARVEEAVEKFSVIKTLQSMAAAQVVVVMIDARENLADQDLTLIGHAMDEGRALVIAVNKWDGMDQYQRDQCQRALERRLVFVDWAKTVFISALHGSGLRELMRAVVRAHAARDEGAGLVGADQGTGKSLRELSAAAGARSCTEAPLCPPRWQQPADDCYPRQPYQAHCAGLSALSGRLFPQAFQVGRYADPDRLPRRREPLRRQEKRAHRSPATQAPADDPRDEKAPLIARRV